MGTDMTAFIEYDKTLYYGQRFPEGSESRTDTPPPFDERSDTYSVSDEGGLYTGSKDYLFFGALAGIRNETGIPPLFAPRGLPSNLSWRLRRHVEANGSLGDFGNGWLTLNEVEAALDHQRINRDLLAFESHTILAIMADLERRLGTSRVRLVFGFNG